MSGSCRFCDQAPQKAMTVMTRNSVRFIFIRLLFLRLIVRDYSHTLIDFPVGSSESKEDSLPSYSSPRVLCRLRAANSGSIMIATLMAGRMYFFILTLLIYIQVIILHYIHLFL